MEAELAVVERSKREAVMEYLWERCIKAWEREEDDVECFNLCRMYCAFEKMSDSEWEEIYDSCDCADQ